MTLHASALSTDGYLQRAEAGLAERAPRRVRVGRTPDNGAFDETEVRGRLTLRAYKSKSPLSSSQAMYSGGTSKLRESVD